MPEHPMTTHVREQLGGHLQDAREQVKHLERRLHEAQEEYDLAVQNATRLERAYDELGPAPDMNVAEMTDPYDPALSPLPRSPLVRRT
jgi:predicted nuclease with TOPRIM domain